MPERPLLAIVLDTADEGLVRRLMDRGDLPAMARLRAEGTWSSVTGHGRIGHTATELTLSTGLPPVCHGIYSTWAWVPERMRAVPMRTDHVRPIWRDLHDRGLSVGLLDAPLTPHLGLSRGFEVTDWAPHYWPWGSTSVSPPELASFVGQEHPFATGRFEQSSAARAADLPSLASACIEGARLRGGLAETLLARTRPDVAVVSFAELHRASHDLWHTVEPDQSLYTDLSDAQQVAPSLADVYRAIDSEIGRLVDVADDDAAVAVFSIAGMRPARGLAYVLLPPVLDATGFSCPARGGMTRGVLAAVKERTPGAVKGVYNRRVPVGTRLRLAAPTTSPALDWSRTRAFAVPADQHGLVRINLRGREAEGLVPASDYRRTCDELAAIVRGLHTVDGRPVVQDVVNGDPSGEPHHLLPDLVVHWDDAAFDRVVGLQAPAIEVAPIVREFTGQHRADGFCVARGVAVPPSIGAGDLIACLTSDAGS